VLRGPSGHRSSSEARSVPYPTYTPEPSKIPPCPASRTGAAGRYRTLRQNRRLYGALQYCGYRTVRQTPALISHRLPTAVEIRREEFPEEPPFSMKLLVCVIPYPPTRPAQRAPPADTVLPAKEIPYPATRGYRTARQTRASSDIPPACEQDHQAKISCKSSHFDRTWFSVRRYRTLWQGMPYPGTNFTVPRGKGYRTVQQSIPYRPTRVSNDIPAKREKNGCRQSVRLVFVFCYMFLCCLRMGTSGK
jgi:hypothetical protein